MAEDILWNDLMARGETAILDLCTQHRSEGQTLEFKAKSDPSIADLSGDDRKNFGKSLSAFSNATSGVLLWGIKANGAEATEPQPITDVDAFADRLLGLLSEYLSPPNPNIKVHAIHANRGSGEGYVAIKIDASEDRPHMSNAPGHHRYYIQNGSATYPMADFLVRDMLRMRTAPRLWLSPRFVARSRSGDGVLRADLVF